MIIKPDWNIFKSKFENPQATFEFFCYLLFCKEFKKTFGISRYKNQKSIETNPISYEGQTVGFQAKFYEATLSSHKKDIIECIKEAKKTYPSLTKIIFYTNVEWGQGAGGGDSKTLTGVKNVAGESNLEVQFNTASFFESPFVCESNKTISEHFFTNDRKSFFDILEERKSQTENILNLVEESIPFKGKKIHIERSRVDKSLKESSASCFILIGRAGVGKTSSLKKWYNSLKDKAHIYLFKASEFNVRTINEILTNYDFKKFIENHPENEERFFIFDSAERIVDLKSQDVLEQALNILIEKKWKIIFTTRSNYAQELTDLLGYRCKVKFNFIELNEIEEGLLERLSKKYNFELPKNNKLMNLIKTPFYLDKYLKYYNENKGLDYTNFKNNLWDRVVKKSKPSREQCFIKIACERAKTGDFFTVPECDQGILDELKEDELLGYESSGYFISHDIYEEWALEKNIYTEFLRKNNNKEFFQNIGETPPARRSFRNWISEKLLLEDSIVVTFIEEVINDKDIDDFWKQELFVSILLSDYSHVFFLNSKDMLLNNNAEILKKLCSLLRVACKEYDNSTFESLGIKIKEEFKDVFTKPKGLGWEAIINFIYENIETLFTKKENIMWILPIIYDWSFKNKEGEATRYCSLIALRFYEDSQQEKKDFFYNLEHVDQMIKIILFGAKEIKEEIDAILDRVLNKKWKKSSDPYFKLSKAILTKHLDGIEIHKSNPSRVLKIANLFWRITPGKRYNVYGSPDRVDMSFGLEDEFYEYSQKKIEVGTPIFTLLQSKLKETIDFILNFTNESVEIFYNSDFSRSQFNGEGEAEKVVVNIDEFIKVEQYICNRFWCMYRETQVSPYILNSMHIALEKYFLTWGKKMSSEALEGWLLYLLTQSKSASISAVVTSIVLEYPEKTFNIAKILFKTKEFFLYDRNRLSLEGTRNFNIFGIDDKYDESYQESKHRKSKAHLESMFLQHQIFKYESDSDEDVKKRKENLWEILDIYYAEEKESKNLSWKMALSRMDLRKMKTKKKRVGDGYLIEFVPELDQKTEDEVKKNENELSKELEDQELEMWSQYKWANNKECEAFEKYNKNPDFAFEKLEQLVKKTESANLSNRNRISLSYHQLSLSTAINVSAVLLRDYSSQISSEKIKYCKNIIFESLHSMIVSEGFNRSYPPSCVSILPIILEKFPEDIEQIKIITFMLLLEPLGSHLFSNMQASDNHLITAFHKMAEISKENFDPILFGYILLNREYREFLTSQRNHMYSEDPTSQISKSEIIDSFLRDFSLEIEKILRGDLAIEDVSQIEDLDLDTLSFAFVLIPFDDPSLTYKSLIKSIIEKFSKEIFKTRKSGSFGEEDVVDHRIRSEFFRKLSIFLLHIRKSEIEEFIDPIYKNINSSKMAGEFFESIICSQNTMRKNENFWKIWKIFEDKFIQLCKSKKYSDEFIKSYLFLLNYNTLPWGKDAKKWHTINKENKALFKRISNELSDNTVVFISILNLLNGIGILYLGRWNSLDILYDKKQKRFN